MCALVCVMGAVALCCCLEATVTPVSDPDPVDQITLLFQFVIYVQIYQQIKMVNKKELPEKCFLDPDFKHLKSRNFMLLYSVPF